MHGVAVASQGQLLKAIAELYPRDALKIVEELSLKAHAQARRVRGGRRRQESRRVGAGQRGLRVRAAHDQGETLQAIANREHVDIATIKRDLKKKPPK